MRISFLVEPHEPHRPVLCVMPVIDDIPLAELVRSYESKLSFTPAGGYGGLIPDFFYYGPLDEYFLGRAKAGIFTDARIYVLGCECGEVGCWPLECQVRIAQETVTWECFRQPYQPERNYSEFGPFNFDLSEYTDAVAQLREQFPITSTHKS